MKKRNGNDLFSIISFIVAAICALIALFAVKFPYYFIPLGIALVFAGYGLFRVLSTNVDKRKNEVQRFVYSLLKLFRKDMSMYQEPKKVKKAKKIVKAEVIPNDVQKVICHCPNCNSKIRLPNKRGKHGVDCPNCKYHFQVKI